MKNFFYVNALIVCVVLVRSVNDSEFYLYVSVEENVAEVGRVGVEVWSNSERDHVISMLTEEALHTMQIPPLSHCQSIHTSSCFHLHHLGHVCNLFF